MRTIAIAVSLIILLSAPYWAGTVYADTKTFEKEYTYQASEIDSKITSRAIAVEQVKRLVLEELGTYLIAETEVRNFQLTRDRVVILTAGIVQMEILNEKWDGEKYYLKAKVKADPNEVAASLDRLRKDTHKTKALEDARKKTDDAQREIAQLKTELESVKASRGKQLEYAKAADTISATDWFKKGLQYDAKKQPEPAIEAYTKAIELDPGFVNAYINRGNRYEDQRLYEMAIRDHKKAIALKPDSVEAHYNLGHAYSSTGQYQKAIETYTRAIELDPNEPDAYNNRGYNYRKIGSQYKAMENFNKAIELKPDHGNALNNRGVSYAMMGNMGRAIADFQKACDLGNASGCQNLRQALGGR